MSLITECEKIEIKQVHFNEKKNKIKQTSSDSLLSYCSNIYQVRNILSISEESNATIFD